MPAIGDRLTIEEVPRLLEALSDGDAEEQRNDLRRLCPCRNRVFDGEVWLAIFDSYYSAPEHSVRHQAEHAIEALWLRSETDAEARELRAWLEARGRFWPVEEPDPKRHRDPEKARVTSRDVPRLLGALGGDDPVAKREALRTLCPCRNRRYDREVWLAIFEAYETGVGDDVRDQAQHAIGTLLQRARTDPRSQELLEWLAQQGVTSMPVAEAIPVWRARPDGDSLRIPVWERSGRSRANRRR